MNFVAEFVNASVEHMTLPGHRKLHYRVAV
jgi:hypothetical protein